MPVLYEWPDPPARMLVVFCSVCNQFLGIRDVDRMQHEHFERSERCRHGIYRAAVYEQKTIGTYRDALLEIDVAPASREQDRTDG